MAVYPWRFQADLKAGEPNPDVTVFVGDTITNDSTGEKTIHQNTADPEIVKLADLASFVSTGLTSGVTRTTKPPMPGAPEATKETK
jgi:hypothetical protein